MDRNMFDLSTVQPASAVGLNAEHGKWRLIPWQSKTRSGRMLYGYPGPAPTVSLPLETTGWCAVSVGLWGGHGWGKPVCIRLRFSGEESWASLRPARRPGEVTGFEEHFWRIADLTGKSLEIAKEEQTVAGLAFVRLIPLTQQQVSQCSDSRRVPWMWTEDSFGIFQQEKDPPARVVREAIDPYKDTVFGDLSYCIVGADLVNYPTEHGTVLGAAGAPAPRDCDSAIGKNLARLLATGADPLELAVDHGRKLGMRVWLSQRMQAFAMEPPYDTAFDSRFCLENPQWACRTRDGRRLMQMSFAFPEVRRHLLEILVEVSERNPDGLHLIFNRGIPCSYYEEPVMDGFRRQHDADIRELDARDPQVVTFRNQYVTTFLRELKDRLRQDGKGGMKVAANVLQTESLNEEFGLDVRTWARDGLVDRLMPFRWEHRVGSPDTAAIDMAYYTDVVEGTPCELYPFAFNGNLDRRKLPHEHRSDALKLIRAGADGLSGWDGLAALDAMGCGQPGALEVWEEIANPLPEEPLTTIGQFVVDEHPPIYGF